ncbi:hypothetical protein DPMN_041913 [Dreissena polymorpha]|uniref:Uncharacterized protein n=1 Tax=Dreissena polymorpha TaxID=45954 RepID=A0A9D4HYA1_DREPO|nr:hypothetical protein DPMN_041913 [Dreissena polymorpha]
MVKISLLSSCFFPSSTFELHYMPQSATRPFSGALNQPLDNTYLTAIYAELRRQHGADGRERTTKLKRKLQTTTSYTSNGCRASGLRVRLPRARVTKALPCCQGKTI